MIQAISVHEKQARSEAMDSVTENRGSFRRALGRRIESVREEKSNGLKCI